MSIFELKHYRFSYPNAEQPALDDLTFELGEGEFLLLCGLSGCGKTTFLRQLKPALTPHGVRAGEINFYGKPLESWNFAVLSSQIGFVMQSPEAQIVTDKVWHELAFGMENLGLDSRVIRLRTAEMASFFGIEDWFDKDVAALSGGQKQLLNLAAVMATQPKVLLLDEPTSQLDPIAASDFLAAVKKINTELGVAVMMVEQRLQEIFPLADRVVVMDGGRIRIDAPPRAAGSALMETGHPMADSLPAPMKIYREVSGSGSPPLTVREGRQWLESLSVGSSESAVRKIVSEQLSGAPEAAIILKDCWFRYEKNGPDILRGLSIRVSKGELYCILGGNGTGKSTALGVIAGLYKQYRGKRTVSGKTAMLPQNPQSLFVMDTVGGDLAEVLDAKTRQDEKERLVAEAAAQMGITPLLSRHPYDLSGGEQQRAALGKVLLTKPDILLLDEPTKGLDAHFKRSFAQIIKRLTGAGVTVIMVSHDIEFCAEYADSCALIFNGTTVSSGSTKEFFAGNSFYTTAANRMARARFLDAVTNEDVIALCGKN